MYKFWGFLLSKECIEEKYIYARSYFGKSQIKQEILLADIKMRGKRKDGLQEYIYQR